MHMHSWTHHELVPIIHHFSATLNPQGPTQVTGVSLSKAVRQGRPSLRVDWTTPQGYATISVYDVQYKQHWTTLWGSQATTSYSATSTILSALNAGTEYDVRVRARSAVEPGEWSEVQTKRTFNSEYIMICCYKVQLHACGTFMLFQNHIGVSLILHLHINLLAVFAAPTHLNSLQYTYILEECFLLLSLAQLPQESVVFH